MKSQLTQEDADKIMKLAFEMAQEAAYSVGALGDTYENIQQELLDLCNSLVGCKS